MKKLLTLITLTLVLLLAVTAAQADWTAYVCGTSDRVHLRSGAGTNYSSMGLYFNGCQGTVHYDSNGWSYITIGSETGWMMTKYLSAGYVTERFPTGYVTMNGAVMRSQPYSSGSVLTYLSYGNTATILGETNTEWYYVSYGYMTGYVQASCMSMGSAPVVTYYPVVTPTPTPYSGLSYTSLLQQVANIYGSTAMYAMTDMNGDGIAELWLKEGTGEADFCWYVYTASSLDGNQASYLGSTGGGHSTLYGNVDGSVYIVQAVQGWETLIRAVMYNRSVTFTQLYSQATGTYYNNGMALQTSPVTNLSLYYSMCGFGSYGG